MKLSLIVVTAHFCLSLALVTVVAFENWHDLIAGIEEVPTRFTAAVI